MAGVASIHDDLGLFAVAQELKAYSIDTCGVEHVHQIIGDSRAVSQATFSGEYQRTHTIDGTVFVAQPDTGMPQSVDTARRLGRRKSLLSLNFCGSLSLSL